MEPAKVLLELYAIRNEVEQKAHRRFAMGIGDAYTDDLRQIDEQIAQIEKRTSFKGFTIGHPETVQIHDTDDLFVFLLSKNGNFTRKALEDDIHYAMEKDSRRHRVLKAIVACKSGGYCQTADLAENAGCSENEFRTTCEELKTQFCKFSGIRRNDVIDGKRRSGYRINPKTIIVEIS
ncbi:MAG: hypothetical protein Q7S76_00465 [bacterium]|nr:hypothetical protein [bacterium]